MNSAQRAAKIALEVRRYRQRHAKLADEQRRLIIKRQWERPSEQKARQALTLLRLKDWA